MRTGAAVTAKKKSLKLDCLTSITTQWWKEKKISFAEQSKSSYFSFIQQLNGIIESLVLE